MVAQEGQWTCPMHPEVVRDAPGCCPDCNMHLESVGPKDTARISIQGPGKTAWSIVGAIGIVAMVIAVWGLSAPAVAGIPEETNVPVIRAILEENGCRFLGTEEPGL